MEHPSGEFNNAVDAITDAIDRLRSLPTWDKWITFHGQGMGSREDSYRFYEIRLLRDKLDVGEISLDIPAICSAAEISDDNVKLSDFCYQTTDLSSRQLARLVDRIFVLHFHLKTFPGQPNDYAVGAEW